MTRRGQLVFMAAEAGPAAWMAPVWRAAGRPVRTIFGTAALAHLQRLNAPIPDDNAILGDGFDLQDAAAVIVSASAKGVEQRIVEQARRQSVPSLQVIDYWGPYQSRFAGLFADRIAVIDRIAKDEATLDGVPEDRLVVVGHPAWEGCVTLPAASRKRLAFISQPVRRHYEARLGYCEQTAYAMLRDTRSSRPDLIDDLVFVPHPEELADHHSSDARSAVQECGTVIGMFSSLMVDAFLAGRQVISLQPNAQGCDMCALSRHGKIRRATSPAELCDALEDMSLAPPTELSATLAGSTARVLSLIEGLTRR
jgi:hypothetical protein